jgi:hypothetical protein
MWVPTKKTGYEFSQGAWNWSSEKNGPDEAILEGSLRELREEFGIVSEDLLPITALGRSYRYAINSGEFDYNLLLVTLFLMRPDAKMDLNSCFNDEPPEFIDSHSIDIQKLLREAPPHKRDAYASIINDALPIKHAIKSIEHLDMSPEARVAHIQRHPMVHAAKRVGRLVAQHPLLSGGVITSSDDPCLLASREERLLYVRQQPAVLGSNHQLLQAAA